MRNYRLLALLLAIVMVAGLVLAGCGGGGNQSEPSEGKEEPSKEEPKAQEPEEMVLNYYLPDEPPDLNPLTTTDTVSFDILNATMEGLVRQQPDGSYPKGSGLAEDWTVSPDGLTYTFKLKDGIKWSTGREITAQDFEYSWKQVIDPRNGAQYAYQMYHIKGAAEVNSISVPKKEDDPQGYEEAVKAIEDGLTEVGVKALDDKTLEVTLERESPFFVSLTAFPTYIPVDRQYYEELGRGAKLGGEYGLEADKLVASGPFKVEKWVHDNEVVLVKNPDYWDADTVKLDKIHFDIVTDNSTVVNMYEAGQLDGAAIGDKFIDQYKAEGKDLQANPDGSIWYLVFNLESPDPVHQKLWNNSKIRQAISYAIDREIMAYKVQKTHVPAKSYTSSVISDLEGNNFFETWVKESLYPAKADPEKAKKLLAEGLAEAGLDAFPDDVVILSDDGDTARTRDQAIQEMLRQNLGIEVKVDPVEFRVRLERMRNKQFDMVFGGWGPDYNDPMTFLDMWVTDGPFNDGGWSNPDYDALYEKALNASENKPRMETFVEMEKMLAEEMPIVTTTERVIYRSWAPYVKGIKISPIGPQFDYKWAYIEGR